MQLASYVYRAILGEKRRGLARVWQNSLRSVRKRWVRASDPDCEMMAHGLTLSMPLSHDLPLYLARFPLYDRLYGRLSAHLRRQHGHLAGIDVGANIGDTVCACLKDGGAQDWFMAVEPHPRFFAHLERNTARFGGRVRCVPALCLAEPTRGGFVALESQGTARLVRDESANAREGATLDALVAEHAGGRTVHFLKIDTDGHDFEVLRGATETLRRDRPAVLLEADVFGRKAYVADVRAAADRFRAFGYDTLIAYDNFGRLFAWRDLAAGETLDDLLTHQLVRGDFYFDLLFLAQGRAFLQEERRFFASWVGANVRGELLSELASPAP